MKGLFSLILLVTAASSFAQVNPTAKRPELSSAERSIAEAQKAIREKPTQCTAYNLLASAFLRRARETSDNSYYTQAEDALGKSEQLCPLNFDTKKIRVSILLGKDDFPSALDAAKILNEQAPDDLMVYGLLTDANAGLGHYKDAETAAQWMLNLRPGNLPALTRTAYLRELFGDLDGSYELLQVAYDSTPPTENEELACLLTQMGHLRLASGNTETAERLLKQALIAFPNYPSALGILAEVFSAQTRYEEAVVLLRQRYQSSPRAGNLYDLAQALRLAGHEDEANKTFAEFEAKSIRESGVKDNSNRQLVFYYADYAKQPAKALEVAEQEYARRKDVYTLDAYAWALHVNGQDVDARKQIEMALAVGIRDGKLLRHAAEISLKLGDVTSSDRYFKQSVGSNPVDSGQVQRMPVPAPGTVPLR